MNKIKLRRIRRVLSTNKFKLIMIAMVSLFLFTSTGYAILNVVQKIDGTATIWVDNKFVCQDGISGKFQRNSSWNEASGKTHYNATITINNDGSEDILTWKLVLKGPSDLEVQTNADIVIDDNGIVTMTPLSWNSLITSGNHVILDVGFITVEEEFDPEYIYINGCLVYGTDVGGSGGGSGSGEEDDDNGDPTVELTGLEISPSTYTMSVGETAPLQVAKTPSDAFATLVWSSSDEKIATVSDSGVVTAVSKGEVVITVSSGEISATSTITVEEESTPPETELTNLILNPTEKYLEVGTTFQFVVTMSPADATVDLVWSSNNEDVAVVDQEGVVTAKAPGEATITVTGGNVSTTSLVYVELENTELVSLTINPNAHTMKVGENVSLQLTKNPVDATDQITWSSSDESIAKVGQDGVVIAIGPGDATITASNGTVSAQSVITVEQTEIILTSLEINPSTHTMKVGNSVTLNAIKNPIDATDVLTWASSDENIAIVNESGVVRAVSKGEVVITVTNGTISAQSIITIEEPTTELTALSITPASYTMTVDEKVVLQVTKTPSDSLATLTWSSDNESVATVAQDGTVTAVGVGDAVITVTNGEISAQSVITVEEAVPPSEVDDVSIEFVTNGNPWGSLEYGYSANFEINITNNSENAINELSFTIGFPEGTSLSIWVNGVTINGNEITYSGNLAANNGSIKLQGQLSFPKNYEINDYLPPVITINEVK